MKKSSTLFLQGIIVLIGVVVLALLLWKPHLEGRNAQATLFEIYFKDLFLVFVYLGSIPFFIALSQAFKLLGYVRQNTVFSQTTVNALRKIKLCAMTIIGFVVIEEVFIFLNESDDRAGGVFMDLVITLGSIVVATAAALFEQIVQHAVDIQSENDLTI